MEELQTIKTALDRAVNFQDVFGQFLGSTEDCRRALRRTYHNLVKVTAPDKNPGSKLAEQLTASINDFYAQADHLLEKGEYARVNPIPGREKVVLAGKYTLTRGSLIHGDITDVHLATNAMGDSCLVKAARFPADNDLLAAEQKHLNLLRDKLAIKKSEWLETVPRIDDSFLIASPGGKRRVNILENFAGFLTGEEIKRRLGTGIDGRTVVWMWKRLIILLDWTANTGLIHGAVLPCHIMFYPDNDGHTTRDRRKHAVRLVDWCYSIEKAKRTKLSGWVPAWKDLYAPEILAKEPLTHTTDMFMAAKTILWMSDQKVVPGSILDSIKKWIHPEPSKRPADTLAYFEEFKTLQKTVYGAARWHDLVVPEK